MYSLRVQRLDDHTRTFQQVVLEAEVRRLLGTGLVTRKHLLEGPGR